MGDISLLRDQRGEVGTTDEELLSEDIIARPILPHLLRVSGLYVYWSHVIRPPIPLPIPRPIPIDPRVPVPPLPPGPPRLDLTLNPSATQPELGTAALMPFFREELRLDVDGQYPQMTASGTLIRGFGVVVHWVAKLNALAGGTWGGAIWYKDGNTSALPHTEVLISVTRSVFPHHRKAFVTFKGGGALERFRTLTFASRSFHPVEFEFDNEVGATPVLDMDTGAHPNRPASVTPGTITLETVFQRAGFNAVRSASSTAIPNDGPDPNATWSDAEMHDAMQVHWSRFSASPNWALWVLFARQHDMGSGLGGVMFDDIGPNHRQGTAIFTNSFIANPPANDAAPDAWVRRMVFWTAAHEMGHAFNLAHSWQKSLGTAWIPLTADTEARSFMNYPFRVSGGQAAFFQNFEFRFSDDELLFMRHAPERFVQMGNAAWFDHHGFQGAHIDPESALSLELHVDRDRPVFEFLEPAVLTLVLRNDSDLTQIVPGGILQDTAMMTVIIKRDGRPAQQWAPFARYCLAAKPIEIAAGGHIRESLFASVGCSGWHLSEPGLYTVQVAIEINGLDVISSPLRLRILPPKGAQEELLAQDVFTDDAGRVMALDGSRCLEAGNAAWQEVAERLPKSRAAIHARVCLALPDARPYRLLRIQAADAGGVSKTFEILRSKPDAFRKEMSQVLMGDSEYAAETLGKEDYRYYGSHYASWLKDAGDEREAKRLASSLRELGERHH